MKIFITGATGYIGQKLVTRLINQGHEIHALCRTRPDGEIFNNTRVKIFEGDILNREKIDEAMNGCEQAYHIAAYARVWAKQIKTFFEVNVQGTVNILDAALHAGVKKLVVTSTGSTYGVSNGKLLSEDFIRKTDFFSEYESSKFMAEEKVLQYALKGLDAVIVQPGRVYGPGVMTESNAVSILIKSYVTGDWHTIPGSGKSIGSFAFIEDVADGHLLAMQHGKAGEKYILGGENADFIKFFSILRQLTEMNYLLVKVPLPLMMLFGWSEEIKARWLGMEPLITRKWIRRLYYDAGYSSDKAITELGYHITPLKEGISKTLKWLQNDHHVYY